MSKTSAALIWCPFADQASAKAAARVLLEERLIACANIIPEIVSVFRWQGAVEEACETGMLCKTDTVLLKRAVARLEQLHPYDTPAIMGWSMEAAPPATLGWLAEQLEQGINGEDEV